MDTFCLMENVEANSDNMNVIMRHTFFEKEGKKAFERVCKLTVKQTALHFMLEPSVLSLNLK